MRESAPFRVLAACLAVWIVAVVITLTGTADDRSLAAVVQALVVGIPMAVGLATWEPRARFPRLLVAVGASLGLMAFSTSDVPVLYSLGRAGAWLVVPGLVYVVLSFPSGRLEAALDRRLAAAAGLLVLVLYVPTLPLTVDFPLPGPWATCSPDCPANTFALVDAQPAFIEDVVRPLREALAIVLLAAVAAVLARRLTATHPPMRAALVPVFAAACAHALVATAFFAVRAADADPDVASALAWAYVASLPVLALAFAAGRIIRLVYSGRALERLAHTLRRATGPADVSAALAETLGDPSLHILRPASGNGGGWVDEHGRPAEPPTPGSGVTVASTDGRPAAAFLHDPLLDGDDELLRAATEMALLRLENARLVERLTGSLEALSESRQRLLDGVDRERRRIERDLHDGAQQGLIGLRIRLSLLEERLRRVAPEEAEATEALGEHLEQAIEQVRTLARGIYPSLLAQYGLEAALRAAARSSPIPVAVEVHQSRRYRIALESTIYFACLEALQNAVKHAAGATTVHIAVRDDGDEVRFEVRDDGSGFTDGAPAGSGLANLRARVAAASGTLTINSAPGEGTLIVGTASLGPPVPGPRAEPAAPVSTPGDGRPGLPRPGT